MADLALQMDRSVPFVAAIYNILDGKGTLQQAVDVFREAEMKTGVTVLGPPAMLPDWKAFMPEIPCSDSDIERGQAMWKPDGPIVQLIDRLHLILTGEDICGMEYNNFLVETPSLGKMVAPMPTWRYWGEITAGWLSNRGVQVPFHPKRKWTYLDFYMRDYVNKYIPLYDEWGDTVLKVLRLKNEQWLEERE
jgi:hypothetical protein